MTRMIATLALLGLLIGCTDAQSNKAPAELGAFRLGHNVVVASKMKKGPVSRNATQEEWVNALTGEIAQRFGRYDGPQLYHLGVSVEGYMLAPPGVPVLYNPRSALIINVTVWDDAAAKKLNAKPEQFTIYEDTTGQSLTLGSGHTRTREEQIAGLSENAVDAIEDWMKEQHETKGWFDLRPEAESAGDGEADATVRALQGS